MFNSTGGRGNLYEYKVLGYSGKYVNFVKVYSTDALLYVLVIIKIFYL